MSELEPTLTYSNPTATDELKPQVSGIIVLFR